MRIALFFLPVPLLLAWCTPAGGGSADEATCDPLNPPPVSLSEILGVGKDTSGTLFVASSPPDGGPLLAGCDDGCYGRVFVSNGHTLERKHVSGTGRVLGAQGDNLSEFLFGDPGADAASYKQLMTDDRNAKATRMALGPSNSKAFFVPGDEPLTVVDPSVVADFSVRNLPVILWAVDDVSDGNVIVVTDPMDDWFHLFYGPAGDLEEYAVTGIDDSRSWLAMSFLVEGQIFTARLDPRSPSLETPEGSLVMTPRKKVAASLRGLAFHCIGQ